MENTKNLNSKIDKENKELQNNISETKNDVKNND